MNDLIIVRVNLKSRLCRNRGTIEGQRGTMVR